MPYAVVYFPKPFPVTMVYEMDSLEGIDEFASEFCIHTTDQKDFAYHVRTSQDKPVLFLLNVLPSHLKFFSHETSLLESLAGQSHKQWAFFQNYSTKHHAVLSYGNIHDSNSQVSQLQQGLGKSAQEKIILTQVLYDMGDSVSFLRSLRAQRSLNIKEGIFVDAMAIALTLVYAMTLQKSDVTYLFVMSDSALYDEAYFYLPSNLYTELAVLLSQGNVAKATQLVLKSSPEPGPSTSAAQFKGHGNLRSYLGGLNLKYPKLAHLFLITLFASKEKAAWASASIALQTLMANVAIRDEMNFSIVTGSGNEINDLIILFNTLGEYACYGTILGRKATITQITTSNELFTEPFPFGMRLALMQFIITAVQEGCVDTPEAAARLNEIKLTAGSPAFIEELMVPTEVQNFVYLNSYPAAAATVATQPRVSQASPVSVFGGSVASGNGLLRPATATDERMAEILTPRRVTQSY